MSADDRQIFLACEEGDLATVTQLVKRNRASVNAKGTDGRRITPLFCAVAKGCDDVAQFLLQNGANPNALDHVGRSALFDAIETGNFSSAALLVAAGADVNLRWASCTPLEFAIELISITKASDRSAVALMLAAGAKGADTTSPKTSAAQLAQAKSLLETAKSKLK